MVPIDETRFRIIRLIELRPEISQRELARELGVSLGKANYCLKALVEKGLVKAANFQKSPNKCAYLYFLTPKGVQEKIGLTGRFLKYKLDEHAVILSEIKQLQDDLLRMNENQGRESLETANRCAADRCSGEMVGASE